MYTGRDCAKCNIRGCHLPFDRYKTFWSWQATESECRNLCGTDGIVVLTVTSDCGTEVPGMRLAGAWRGVSG